MEFLRHALKNTFSPPQTCSVEGNLNNVVSNDITYLTIKFPMKNITKNVTDFGKEFANIEKIWNMNDCEKPKPDPVCRI